MRMIKFGLIVLILLFVYKHHNQKHLSGIFSFHSQEYFQEQIQELDQQINFRKEIIADIYQHIAKVPAVGSVVGRTACGASITVGDNGVTQMLTEINRLQGEITTFEKSREQARQMLKPSQPD